MSRFACLWVPCFIAAAHVRGDPTLADQPMAVLTSRGEFPRVVEANETARAAGVKEGMTEVEARAWCAALVCHPFTEAWVTAARHALASAALAVSPRVEDTGPGCAAVDIDGLEGLFGHETAIAERLIRQARAVGLAARVGVATSRTAAHVAARLGPRVTVIPPGQDRDALAAASLAALDLSDVLATTFQRWGVRTLGELAALPRDGVAVRLGAAGVRAHDRARGVDRDPFRTYTPPPFWEETRDIDWDIDSIEALAAVLDVPLERLTARLAAAHVVADSLELQLQLASGGHHRRAIVFAYPTREPALLRTSMRLELTAHPPPEPVRSVMLSVRPVRARAGQGGLWERSGPAPRDLETLLIRLAELVGPDNLGVPTLVDTHRPDAVVLGRFEPEHLPEPSGHGSQANVEDVRLVLRRLRPPSRVSVQTEDGRPCHVAWNGRWLPIVAAAGPWLASGEWWDGDAWTHADWDLRLRDGTLCRLVHDRLHDQWFIAAIYD